MTDYDKKEEFEGYLRYLINIKEVRKSIQNQHNVNQKEMINFKALNQKGMF